jgi:hypothetical protein
LAGLVVAVLALLASACVFDGAWTGVAVPDPPGATAIPDLSVVSCPLVSTCVAAGSAAAVWNGTTWSSLTRPPAPVTSLACSSATNCLAGVPNGATGGSIRRLNGSTWQATNWPDARPVDVACASATTCLAVGVGPSGAVAGRWDGASFTPVTVNAAANPTSVSCASPTFCLAVGNTATGPWAATWTGAALTEVPVTNVELPGLVDASCLTATLCYVAAGQVGRVATWNGTTLTGGADDPSGARGWLPFACGAGSPNRCFGHAVDYLFNATIRSTLGPASSFQLGGGRAYGLTCRTATDCMAVGADIAGSHAAWHWNGVGWSATPFSTPVPADPRIEAVSCSAPDACTAVGTYAHGFRRHPFAIRWDGATWQSTPIPNVDDSTTVEQLAVSCPTATYCGITSALRTTTDDLSEFHVELWAGGGTSWDFALFVAMPMVCTAPGSCLGLGGGQVVRWTPSGTTSTNLPVPIPGPVQDLACADDRHCAAIVAPSAPSVTPAIDASRLVWFDGTSATTTSPLPAPPGQVADLADISCVASPASRRCVAVGMSGVAGSALTLGTPYAVAADDLGAWKMAALPTTGPGRLVAVSCADTAECVAVGSGSVGGTSHPGLTLTRALDSWTLAPDHPITLATDPFVLGCEPLTCVTLGRTGADPDHHVSAGTYRWTLPTP